MAQNMGNLLSDFILDKTRGMNQVNLAKALGVSQSFLSRLKSGQIKKADATLAVDMAVFFNEPIEKMLSLVGKEKYYLRMKEALSPSFQKDPTIIELFPDEATKLEYSKFRSRDDFLPVRILGDPASLGPGRLIAQEKTQGYALIDRHALPRKAEKQTRQSEKIVCLYVKGESMQPTIRDGSLVAIDIEDKIETQNGKIYAVSLSDEEGVTIKRIFHQHGFLILQADNRDDPNYPRCLPLKGLNYNPICGKVVWCWNRLD